MKKEKVFATQRDHLMSVYTSQIILQTHRINALNKSTIKAAEYHRIHTSTPRITEFTPHILHKFGSSKTHEKLIQGKNCAGCVLVLACFVTKRKTFFVRQKPSVEFLTFDSSKFQTFPNLINGCMYTARARCMKRWMWLRGVATVYRLSGGSRVRLHKLQMPGTLRVRAPRRHIPANFLQVPKKP